MRLHFRPDITAVVDPGSRLVLLITEDATYVSRDPMASGVVERIAAGEDPEPEHAALVADWTRQGFLVPAEEEPAVPPEEAALWSSAGLPSTLSGAPVLELLPWAPAGTNLCKQALEAAGFQVGSGGLLIALVDDYLSARLDELHVACREQQRPWLPVKVAGHTAWIGPVFTHQAEHPCWACLAHHLRRNRWRQGLLWGHGPKSYPPQFPVAMTSTTLSLAAASMAHILGAWARGSKQFPLADRLYTFDTRSLVLLAHTVMRRPNCPDCGPGIPLDVPRSVEEFRRFRSPIAGLVPAVELQVREAGLIHARADVLQPLPLDDARPLMNPNVAIGKGVTSEDAEIGCLAEAAERYSIVFQGDEPRVRASRTGDADLDRVNVDQLLQISPRQYAERERWAKLDDPRQWIPRPYDTDQELDWTAATVLGPGLGDAARVRYVPTAYCYLGHPAKDNCRPDTNGCAAGQSREDAIRRGLLELIERDAAAIWWYNRVARPSVRPGSVRDPAALLVIREFERMGRRVYLLDLTNDAGVPVYAAVTTTRDGRELFFGLGCSTDPGRAAFQALSEMGQVWFWIRRRSKDDPLWRDWVSNASLETEPYLQPSGEVELGEPVAAAAAGRELDYCLERLSALGLEALWLDLTRPDVGLPVARVIVPGLRHFWPRFAPGRLYDVPVKLGWRAAPTREEDLNPVPCLL